MKTNKSASKRFSKTKSGKIKCKKPGLRHILSTKSPAQKRRLRGSSLISDADQPRISKIMPYA
jgi:large subunit ribosomal protein L35